MRSASMPASAKAAFAAGMHDVALVLGAEKLKNRPTRGLSSEGEHPYQTDGLTAPGIFAMAATRYLHQFNVGREALAKVAVKNHDNGAKNSKAHFQMRITEQQALNAPMVAWPFGLFDCCPTTDGAAAAVICRTDMAKQFRDDYVLVKGLGLAVTSGRPWYDPAAEYTGFASTRQASEAAYKMAGIQDPVKEID